MLRAKGWSKGYLISWLGLAITLGGTSQNLVGQPPPPPPVPLPPIPVPAENPITQSKRVLGKMLFWDEQLSSDNTVSCGTCHKPAFGGTDPRLARNPSDDNLLNTPDDVIGSPGVVHCDSEKEFEPDPIFGLERQITPRAANPALTAMYSPDLFWDGRARTTFLNPQTGAISIPNGGALESQAIAPIVSEVEMSHDGRDWAEVTAKLATIRPLVLATNLPADMSDALHMNPTYPDLFAAAFGDSAITGERIAYAIATYERTLLPDQTPWDRFIAGDNAAMSAGQIQGWNTLRASPCLACHAPPMFTNNSFQNIGLRPVAEDLGRQIVTGLPANRGQFKVPTLRNVGLKETFMHTGVFTTLPQVIGFYANGPGQFPDNRSPLLPIGLPPPTVPAVVDFLANGLTDPRVANEQFPFDRPMLRADLAPNPSLSGTGVAGSGAIAPQMIAFSPPNVGNLDFKIGVNRALGGAEAYVAWSDQPPVAGELIDATLHGPVMLSNTGSGNGYGTWKFPIDEATIESCDVYLQWRIIDPGAPNGVAMSQIAHLRMIPYVCATGDMNCDDTVNGLDIPDFMQAVLDPIGYAASHEGCAIDQGDLNADTVVNVNDLVSFASALVRG